MRGRWKTVQLERVFHFQSRNRTVRKSICASLNYFVKRFEAPEVRMKSSTLCKRSSISYFNRNIWTQYAFGEFHVTSGFTQANSWHICIIRMFVTRHSVNVIVIFSNIQPTAHGTLLFQMFNTNGHHREDRKCHVKLSKNVIVFCIETIDFRDFFGVLKRSILFIFLTSDSCYWLLSDSCYVKISSLRLFSYFVVNSVERLVFLSTFNETVRK